MLFAHDTEVSLNATAALVNTARSSGEELPDIAALDAFVAHWRWTGSRTHDQAELDAVRALRPRLAALWDMTEDEAVVLVNALLRDASALPSWSGMTAGSTTSTRPRQTRRSPTAWRWTPRWRSRT